MTKATAITTPVAAHSPNSFEGIENLGTNLSKFIKEKKLTTPIKGKDYVHVEAWMFIGMYLGYTALCTNIQDLSTGDEIKYKAQVEIKNRDGIVVGSGFSLCSNKEEGKKFFTENAIASMAQTRATSKAYRLILSPIIKAAGFEATPAEEMTTDSDATELIDLNNLTASIIMQLDKCNTMDDLKMLYGSFPELKLMSNAVKACADKRKAIEAATKPAEAVQEASQATEKEPMTNAQKSEFKKLIVNPLLNLEEKKQYTPAADTWRKDTAEEKIQKLREIIESRK